MPLVSMNSKYGTVIRYFLLATVCMLLLPLFSFGDIKNGEQSDVSDTPIQKKQLKTIIVDNYYPYTFVNQNGDPDGFSVDLIRAVAQEMGLKLKIDVDTWDPARNALKDGNIDVLPMMAYSKERDRQFDFSVPHTIAYDAFFMRKGESKIRSLDDLRGKKIIVMKGDQANDYLLSTGLIASEQLILIESLPDALRLLSSGKGDAALMPKLVGLIVAKNLNLSNLELSPIVIEAYNRPFSFAVAEGNLPLLERLSQGLSIVKTSDEYSNIYNKWFGTLEPRGLSLITVLKYIGGIILVFLLIGSVLLLWSFSLRRQVALRTSALAEEIAERKQTEAALRESEDKYRRIFENILDVYYESSLDGTILEISPSIENISQYKRKELIGRSLYDIYTNPKERDGFLKLISDKGKVNDFEISLTDKDGSKHPCSITTLLVKDKHGNPIKLTGSMRDISERKQSEDKRKKLEAQLQQAQKMEAIGALAGGIAHDFNNLLMAIQGRASIMLMKMDSSHPDFGHLTGIEDNVESAADLTRQLLGFARGEKYEVKPTDLNELIKDQNRMFGRTKKEITIRGKYEENLWSVEVDRGQIEQVLLNLYVNAWQAMPAGGNLYLETENANLDENYVKPFSIEPGRYVKISVTDTGVGMDKATRERIFEPFFTTKEMGRGTGLGLASAYGIIKNHGGFINVYSEKGHGTTFNVYLPVSEEEVSEEKKSTGDTLRGSETVLFIDDEDMIIEVAEELLDALGYKVLIARSGKEAIEIFEENKERIDIVLLDMIMPDMSGGVTYDRLKDINPKVKVLLSSGYGINGQATEILDRGCNGFIQKPFKMKQLSQKLREILDKE